MLCLSKNIPLPLLSVSTVASEISTQQAAQLPGLLPEFTSRGQPCAKPTTGRFLRVWTFIFVPWAHPGLLAFSLHTSSYTFLYSVTTSHSHDHNMDQKPNCLSHSFRCTVLSFHFLRESSSSAPYGIKSCRPMTWQSPLPLTNPLSSPACVRHQCKHFCKHLQLFGHAGPQGLSP